MSDLSSNRSHVWQKQPGESRQAFAAFVAFRDAGATRSITKVAAGLSKSRGLMSRWSSRWNWHGRADAWDAHLEAEWVSEARAQRREAARRHVQITQDVQAKIVARLASIDADTLTAADLIRLLDVSVRIEREALGMGQRLEVTGAGGGPISTVELTPLTDEERNMRMITLRRELDLRIVGRDHLKLVAL